jgi:hypothetical protein
MNLAPGEFEGGSHDQSAAQNWLAGLRLLPFIRQPARDHRPLVQLSCGPRHRLQRRKSCLVSCEDNFETTAAGCHLGRSLVETSISFH